MNISFLDVSLGSLRATLWHDHLGKPHQLQLPLSSTSPLSDILTTFWEKLYTSLKNASTAAVPDKLYFLQGPGPLTSLRVLFAHALALKTAHPQTEFFTLPTPQWVKHYLARCQQEVPQSFIHQVGRFAFITGVIDDLATYKTHHIRTDQDWNPVLSSLHPPTVFIGPQPFSKIKTIWIQPNQLFPPEHIYPTLELFHPLQTWADFKPIQPD